MCLPTLRTTIARVLLCSACSSLLPPEARFCPQCGTPVDPTIAPHPTGNAATDFLADHDEERRIVTVLFADLVGFTSLAEGRDPEQVKRLIDNAFEDLVDVIEAHGGTIDKLLGDGIIAVFGAPIAHEDDADRAVRAGLAMQSALAGFRSGHPSDVLRMRIGINTGEVLIGQVAGTDVTVMGDTVNTAARIQEVAPPNTVMIGESTRELTSPSLALRPFTELQLRGRAERTTIWQAISHDAVLVERRWRTDGPYVGRASERTLLRNTLEMSLRGRSSVISVIGEAGIGKSRLVSVVMSELLDAHPDIVLIEGICAPYGEANVWWPVVGGFLARLGLHRNLDAADARETVSERLASLLTTLQPDELERAVELSLHLLGFASSYDELSPGASRDMAFAGITNAIRTRATAAPVVIWLDDIQWAAPQLLALLESAARQFEHLPVAIVTTSREEDLGQQWPPSELAISLRLPLDPLDDVDSGDLIDVVAQQKLTPMMIEQVLRRAGGNPLYLTELTRLAENQAGAADEVTLPGSLRALVAAQLDELDPRLRNLIDDAAVLGSDGRVESLRDFAATLGHPIEAADLETLVERGLLSVEHERWRFRSDVVREVAYETLTKQLRAQRHAGVAIYLAEHEPSLVEPRAYHASAAAASVRELGEIPDVPSTITAEAVELLTQSARRWARQGAYRRSVELGQRALSLVDAFDPVRAELLVLVAEGYLDLHELKRADQMLERARAAALVANDRVAIAETHRLNGSLAQLRGDLVEARFELGEAVASFRELNDQPRLAETLRLRGYAEVFGGSLNDAEWFFGEAEAAFLGIGDRSGVAWVLQNRAWVSFLSGDHETSEQRLHSAIDIFQSVDDQLGVAWSFGLLAYVYFFQRRATESEHIADEVLARSNELGERWGSSMMTNLKAGLRLWSGQSAEALALAERALAGFRRIDDRFGMILALATTARAQVAQGQASGTERTVEEILSLSDAFGELSYATMAAAGAKMHLGDGATAIELALPAIERIDTLGANIGEARTTAAFGQLLIGNAEAALIELDDFDVPVSPFALAARSLARVLTGDNAGALDDLSLVEAMPMVSYWDRTIALTAGVVAARRDQRSPLAEELTVRLGDELQTFDDQVIASFAHTVLAAVNGEPQAAPARLHGWALIADRLSELVAAT